MLNSEPDFPLGKPFLSVFGRNIDKHILLFFPLFLLGVGGDEEGVAVGYHLEAQIPCALPLPGVLQLLVAALRKIQL